MRHNIIIMSTVEYVMNYIRCTRHRSRSWTCIICSLRYPVVEENVQLHCFNGVVGWRVIDFELTISGCWSRSSCNNVHLSLYTPPLCISFVSEICCLFYLCFLLLLVYIKVRPCNMFRHNVWELVSLFAYIMHYFAQHIRRLELIFNERSKPGHAAFDVLSVYNCVGLIEREKYYPFEGERWS